jgi:hypothetical protein
MPSNIWLLALLTLGNTLSSESIGRIVRLDLPRNPDHRNACLRICLCDGGRAGANQLRQHLWQIADTSHRTGVSMKTAIDDPTFAAIENHRQAEAAWVAVCDDEHNGLCDVSIARLTELLTMTPTSVAGCAAMLRHVAKYADSYDGNLLENYCAEVKEPAGTLLIRIAGALDRASG